MEDVCDTLRRIDREAVGVGAELHRRSRALHQASRQTASVAGAGGLPSLLRDAAESVTRAALLLEQAAAQGGAFVARNGAGGARATARGSVVGPGVTVHEDGGAGARDRSSEVLDIARLQALVATARDPATGLLDPGRFVAAINPGRDRTSPVIGQDPYGNNCGLCAQAVAFALSGRPAPIASGSIVAVGADEMERFTGVAQSQQSVHSIPDVLRHMPAGSHAIVGADWETATGKVGGHWFNAYWDGHTVWYVDGQTGECSPWPPMLPHEPYQWDASFFEGVRAA
nr:toxin glutamine deamidase domain-containing protein [Curtobacterium pusillum]